MCCRHGAGLIRFRAVPSVDPSSITRISWSIPAPSSTSRISRTELLPRLPQLYAGRTTETAGVGHSTGVSLSNVHSISPIARAPARFGDGFVNCSFPKESRLSPTCRQQFRHRSACRKLLDDLEFPVDRSGKGRVVGPEMDWERIEQPRAICARTDGFEAAGLSTSGHPAGSIPIGHSRETCHHNPVAGQCLRRHVDLRPT